MAKKLFFILAFLILSAHYGYAQSVSPQLSDITNLAPLKKTDRILVLVPHPDDETIGCAGIIQEAVRVGAPVNVVYLTNGDHNQVAFIVYEKRLTLKKGEFIHMGEVRKYEAIKAMKLLGLNEKNLIFLGYPDFGTFAIFSSYWQSSKPFKSLLTRISCVPYKENLSYGAPYKGESILNDLKSVLLTCKPNKIFVSHPADTNVDHKAFYLFLQIALSDLHKELPWPRIYPYLIHCLGWPLPRHYHPELPLLPPKQFLDSQISWFQYKLSRGQLDKKYQAVFSYKSQTESSAFYLLSFARKNELFGDYPEGELKKQGVLLQADGQVSYGLLGDFLLARINKTKKIDRKFSAIFYFFGYSAKTAFAQMPKIRIIVRNNKIKVFDKKSMLKTHGVSVGLDSSGLILRVPLWVLGDPEFILVSLKSYRGMLPVDVVAFRKINIK